MKNIIKGSQAEDHAAKYLQSQGYEILYRNYRYCRHQIDIICKLNDVIIFVEVKYRQNTDYFTIGNKQYNNILQLIAKKFDNEPVQIDVILITNGNVLHIKNVIQ